MSASCPCAGMWGASAFSCVATGHSARASAVRWFETLLGSKTDAAVKFQGAVQQRFRESWRGFPGSENNPYGCFRTLDGLSRAHYADLARLAHVSRARITRIMNLFHLAPDIQEAILFLPRTDGRRAPIRERHIRPICAVPDWRKQRRLWRESGAEGARP